MSWNIGNLFNLFLGLKDKLGIYHVFLKKEEQKLFLTILESQNLPKLGEIDKKSQISNFEWTLHNGRRKICIEYRNDLKKITLIEFQRKGVQWTKKESLSLDEQEYSKLLETIPQILFYVSTFKKTCIHLDESTQQEQVE